MAEYRSGVCNIGRNQVLLRYAMGAVGFAAAGLYLYWFLGSGLSRVFVLVAFFPLLVGFEGLYQGRTGFCAAFGVMGVYDFRGSGGGRGRVESEDAHRRDRQRALKIHLYSGISAAVLTAAAYLLV